MSTDNSSLSRSRKLVDGEIQSRWHKVLKRHEHESDVEHRDSKRVQFTHKQPGKRADMELTDDTAAKRTKLFDTSSFSSSSHEIVPNLHDSSGEFGDPGTRESVTKKSRVGADMEISAIDALTHAKFEVDRALDKASKTLHRLLEEIPLESEAVTKAEELNSIRDKRLSTLRCVRAKPTPILSAASWC